MQAPSVFGRLRAVAYAIAIVPALLAAGAIAVVKQSLGQPTSNDVP